MINKKTKKELLNEELKKFNMLSEYSFYEDRSDEDEVGNLILGDDLEEDDGSMDSDDVLSGEETPEDELEGDAEVEPEADAEEEMEEPGFGEEPEADMSLDNEEGLDDFSEPEMEEPAGDEVELDVTELVRGSEEAKQSADAANEKIETLMNMVTKLEGQLSSMDSISQKIDSLEAEVEKRVPTDDEKLELRSLDSAPFKMRLGDYWAEKEGKYDVMGTNEPTEYELTQDDVNNYSDSDIKQSFNNDYTEEDI